MALFSTWGACRVPNCNHRLRANSRAVFCNAHELRDIRYASPVQVPIKWQEMDRALTAVARLRRLRKDVDWHLMAENWRMLVVHANEIRRSKDADLRHRRRAAEMIGQIGEAISADCAVDIIAAAFVLEAHDQHNGHRRFVSDAAFKACTLHVLRRTAKAGRVCNVGGRDARSHFSYRRLHKTARDHAIAMVWEYMSSVGHFIGRAAAREEDAKRAHREKLMAALTSL
jgi:hypothetical protein